MKELSDDQVKSIMSQITWCDICGDGIPTRTYPEHLDYCIKRVFKNLVVKVDEIIKAYDRLPVQKEIAGKGIIDKIEIVKREFEVMAK